MNFFKAKTWPFWQVAMLKLYCLVVGIIIGAHITSAVKAYLWLFILVAALLAIELCHYYFIKKN